jgi:cell division protein FtsA
MLNRQVRLGRPHTVRGLPDSASGPAFATAAGLLHWAAGEGRTLHDVELDIPQPDGFFRRIVNFIRERV